MSRLVACFDRAQARVWLAVPSSVGLHARVQLRSFFIIQPARVGKWIASFTRGPGQREAGAPESSNQTCGMGVIGCCSHKRRAHVGLADQRSSSLRLNACRWEGLGCMRWCRPISFHPNNQTHVSLWSMHMVSLSTINRATNHALCLYHG